MRSILAIGLFIIMLFLSGFTQAAVVQPHEVNCRKAVTLTTSSQLVFEGPKLGWVKIPVEIQTLRCCQAVEQEER